MYLFMYLFILTLEILFFKGKGIEIFEHCFLCAAYTAIQMKLNVFLKGSQTIAHVVEIFSTFSLSSGAEANLTKYKVARIGALKRFQLAVWDMKCIDLCNEAIKISGTYFSCKNTIKEECDSSKIISSVQTVMKLLQFHNLTLEV